MCIYSPSVSELVSHEDRLISLTIFVLFFGKLTLTSTFQPIRLFCAVWLFFTFCLLQQYFQWVPCLCRAVGTAQGVDLAYLQTGISGVFFWVLNFENLYFLGTAQSCCIFFVC